MHTQNTQNFCCVVVVVVDFCYVAFFLCFSFNSFFRLYSYKLDSRLTGFQHVVFFSLLVILIFRLFFCVLFFRSLLLFPCIFLLRSHSFSGPQQPIVYVCLIFPFSVLFYRFDFGSARSCTLLLLFSLRVYCVCVYVFFCCFLCFFVLPVLLLTAVLRIHSHYVNAFSVVVVFVSAVFSLALSLPLALRLTLGRTRCLSLNAFSVEHFQWIFSFVPYIHDARVHTTISTAIRWMM